MGVPGCLVSSMDQLSPLDLSTTQIPRRSSVSDGESGTSRSGSPSLSVTPTPSDITTSGAGDHHFTTKRFLYKYQAQQSESLVNNQDLITYGINPADLQPVVRSRQPHFHHFYPSPSYHPAPPVSPPQHKPDHTSQEQAGHELRDHGQSPQILLPEGNPGQGGRTETGLPVRGYSSDWKHHRN